MVAMLTAKFGHPYEKTKLFWKTHELRFCKIDTLEVHHDLIVIAFFRSTIHDCSWVRKMCPVRFCDCLWLASIKPNSATSCDRTHSTQFRHDSQSICYSISIFSLLHFQYVTFACDQRQRNFQTELSHYNSSDPKAFSIHFRFITAALLSIINSVSSFFFCSDLFVHFMWFFAIHFVVAIADGKFVYHFYFPFDWNLLERISRFVAKVNGRCHDYYFDKHDKQSPDQMDNFKL